MDSIYLNVCPQNPACRGHWDYFCHVLQRWLLVSPVNWALVIGGHVGRECILCMSVYDKDLSLGALCVLYIINLLWVRSCVGVHYVSLWMKTHCVDYSIEASPLKNWWWYEGSITQFCAEEIIKQQLEANCVELRGQFSYEEGKYFPAWTVFTFQFSEGTAIVLLAGQGSVLQTGLTRFFFSCAFFLSINFLYSEWFMLKMFYKVFYDTVECTLLKDLLSYFPVPVFTLGFGF